MPVPDTLEPISHFVFFEESSGVWKVEFRDIQGIPIFQFPKEYVSSAGCKRAIRILKEALVFEEKRELVDGSHDQ